GNATPTQATLGTGPCNSCHSGDSSLSVVAHANANRATCHACHVPLVIEPEGPIYVRTHFIHSRSDRFDAKLTRCANCHLTRASIQRTSKSACLSCHRSYPADHVTNYGPITSIFVGDPVDGFNQCTNSCHTNHPKSGL